MQNFIICYDLCSCSLVPLNPTNEQSWWFHILAGLYNTSKSSLIGNPARNETHCGTNAQLHTWASCMFNPSTIQSVTTLTVYITTLRSTPRYAILVAGSKGPWFNSISAHAHSEIYRFSCEQIDLRLQIEQVNWWSLNWAGELMVIKWSRWTDGH